MKLHEQNKLRALRAQTAHYHISRFRDYLAGPKFAGYHPQDGSPNDWIATHEVRSLLALLTECLDGTHDEEIANDPLDDWTIASAP